MTIAFDQRIPTKHRREYHRSNVTYIACDLKVRLESIGYFGSLESVYSRLIGYHFRHVIDFYYQPSNLIRCLSETSAT